MFISEASSLLQGTAANACAKLGYQLLDRFTVASGCFSVDFVCYFRVFHLSSEYCRRLAAPKEIKPHGIQVCLVAEMLFSIFVLQLFCSSHELFLFFRVGRQNRPSSPDWPKTWRHRREYSGIWARIRLSAVFPTSFPKLKLKKTLEDLTQLKKLCSNGTRRQDSSSSMPKHHSLLRMLSLPRLSRCPFFLAGYAAVMSFSPSTTPGSQTVLLSLAVGWPRLRRFFSRRIDLCRCSCSLVL